MDAVSWVPLESNPDVMNVFLKNVGVPTSWKLCDVFGLDTELLAMVPQPVASLILLFPSSKKLDSGVNVPSNELFFMKQTVSNACGTVALVHAVANNKTRIPLSSDSVLSNFLSEASGKSPEEIAEVFKHHQGLCNAHADAASKGQTEAPDPEGQVCSHFVSLVHHNGVLYEFDGRDSSPRSHGSTSAETFLYDAAEVCKKFIAKDPENLNFSVIALAAADN